MIQIVDKPYLFPQRCFFTGDGLPRPIIDTGVNDTEGGRVYMSLSFADDLAAVAGYISYEEAAALRAENELLRKQVEHIPHTLERLIDDLRGLAADAVLSLLAGDPDDAVPVDAVGVEGPEGDVGAVPESGAAARV